MKGFYDTLDNKTVVITTISFSGVQDVIYKGKVENIIRGVDTNIYIMLDTGEMVNTKYIRSIKIVD